MKRKPWKPPATARGAPAKPRSLTKAPTEMRRGSGRAPKQDLVPRTDDDRVYIKLSRKLGDSVIREYAQAFHDRYRCWPTNDGIIEFVLSFFLSSPVEVTTATLTAVVITLENGDVQIHGAYLTERAAFQELRSVATTFAFIKGAPVDDLRTDPDGVFRILGREFRILPFKLLR